MPPGMLLQRGKAIRQPIGEHLGGLARLTAPSRRDRRIFVFFRPSVARPTTGPGNARRSPEKRCNELALRELHDRPQGPCLELLAQFGILKQALA